jgi:hypothetical protein
MKKLLSLLSLLMLSYMYGNANPLVNENSSITINNNRVNGPYSTIELMRMNLYAVYPDGTNYLVDGTLDQYGPNYSNNLDGYDARKMYNPGVNISLIRGTTDLVIERRQTIVLTDSIFFRMWGMQRMNYKMELVGTNLNHPGLLGFLEDNYLHSSTPLNLNDTTEVNFIVNTDPGSIAQNRFRIIFKTDPSFAPLPLTFTFVKAYQQQDHINIDWKTENETNMKKYIVERLTDGSNFVKQADVNANNLASNNYHWVDTYPAEGNNYYRISSIEIDGIIKYSEVVKVYVRKANQGISLFPNPATGNNLNLQLVNQQTGIYEVRLVNSFGQTYLAKTIQYNGGTSIENLKPGQNIPKGIYQLEIKKPGGEKKVMSVVF